MNISPELASALTTAAGMLVVAFIVTNKTILKWVDSFSGSKNR